ncbi:hypothetical protein SteCoe_15519 [Stentor coeruleus]|uniref:Palmitoyltransferase n=1 Tax=Stentor coeruleus TaxID=5963 RepID=A0A1R2C3J7_9CILI|nr:hypothetical protein SteCoe_15519 [Stentor coeruleus]
MQTNDTIGFTYTLKNTSVSLEHLNEPNGKNIFHDIAECVSKESQLLQYLEILTTEFQDRYFDEAAEMIKTMLDAPAGREMYTPLMFAVKNNRRKLLKEFVKLGGNYMVKNYMGQNLVHLSAANGFEGILVYLCTVLKMPIDETEMNGRTPLHLAALENQPSSGLQLIAWSQNLDQQDTEGFTPLHLAALSQAYKIVRNLLIMGANKNITDNRNERPLDISLSRGDLSIINLLKNSECKNYLNPFRHKIGPISDTYTKLAIFIMISLFRAGFIVSAILPHMDIYILYTSAGIFLLAVISFFIVSTKNPGYITINKEISLMCLYEKYRYEYICVYCEAKKPKNTRHCHYCRRCVKDYDHHCPWIHNCVGKNNHFWFMLFLIFSILDYTFQGVVGVLDFFRLLRGTESFLKIVDLPEEKRYMELIIVGINFGFLLMVFPVLGAQILNIFRTPKKKLRTESRDLDKKSLGSLDSFGENSDTASMLLMSSSEWNPSVIQNQISFLSPKNVEVDSGCCWNYKKNES